MRFFASFLMVAIALLSAPAARAGAPLFSDDFSTDPATSGKWTLVTSGTPLTAYDSAGQTFYLTQMGGYSNYSGGGVYMLANTPLKTHRWEATFRYRISNPFQGGGDGMTFMFYKKGGYTPGAGGYLGFTAPSTPQPGYGVIIDNWYNPGWDPADGFFGLIQNTAYASSDKLAWVDDSRTEDAVWHDMKVRFIDGQVTVFVDGSELFSSTLATPDYTFEGIGFSAGIANAQNDQQVDDFSLVDLAPAVWTATGSMNLPRGLHTATRLADGKVLAFGGYNSMAELYDPATGTWSFTGSASTSRLRPTATLLNDGRVLVTGGENGSALATAELYDPATGTWSATGSMSTGRKDHTATLLSNGTVLVMGGFDASSSVLATAELYDPATGTWTPVGSLSQARGQHTSVRLASGQVLVSGGKGSSGSAVSSAELYDPATGTWSTTGSLVMGRHFHTATVLGNGRVLVAGGNDASSYPLSSAELYDPATGTWSATGSLAQSRRYHTANVLSDGRVLVAGGYSEWYGIMGSAELFDPVTGAWSAAASMGVVRYHHTTTVLSNGRILATGGFSTGNQASAELYGAP